MTETPRDRLSQLTLEQEAALLSGTDFWSTRALPGHNIPSIMLTDGPHGLRKQSAASDHLGLNDSVPATCFPPAAGLSSSFDPELAERVGVALGLESAIEDVAVILGPGINIKRSPLCGRNFEYVSEDPIVAGEIGAALVRGIQSQGVGASVKHFAVNNQESDRHRVSADADERTLREIYLRGFQRVVTDASPWTVMCSYNRINGVPAAANHWLLTEVLREQWGFGGVVVSDWGAVDDLAASVAAGLDLEMPGGGRDSAGAIAAAVAGGGLAAADVDTAAARMLDLVTKAEARPAVEGPLDVDAHHALAREAAGRSIVLLQNESVADSDGLQRPLLPLDTASSIAVIGEFARSPRFQGGGSSHINPTRVDSALDALTEALGGGAQFAPGFAFDAAVPAEEQARLRDEAVALAAAQDIAVVFLGLTDDEESEGFDRTHIDLSPAQLTLLDAVLEANPRTVVVLSNGAVVRLPFAGRVPAILETWLLGQAGGSAVADVLLGRVNPSGRLAETIPQRLEDTPAFGNFPGEHQHVNYGEGIFVGYRWYDARQIEVAYPFGHGLSYTSFAYGDVSVQVVDSVSGDLIVTVPVTNTGASDGREVVQVYVGRADSAVQRAPRELKAFASAQLAAGETREVVLHVRGEDLAYWDTRADRFVVEPGEYLVEVGASSRDLRTRATAELVGEHLTLPLTFESTVGEVLAHPVAGPIVLAQLAGGEPGEPGASEGDGDDTMLRLMSSFPIGKLANFPGRGLDAEAIAGLIALANGATSE